MSHSVLDLSDGIRRDHRHECQHVCHSSSAKECGRENTVKLALLQIQKKNATDMTSKKSSRVTGRLAGA